MADTNDQPIAAKREWTSPVLEPLGDATDVLNNTGNGGDGGTPGDNAS